MLFGKNTVEIYESHKKQEFKKIQKRLKDAGIRYYAVQSDLQSPVGGCGAKLDIRTFMRKDAPDFTTYFIRVSEADAERARRILEVMEND